MDVSNNVIHNITNNSRYIYYILALKMEHIETLPEQTISCRQKSFRFSEYYLLPPKKKKNATSVWKK